MNVVDRLAEFVRGAKKIKGLIYILLWTTPSRPPFNKLGLESLFRYSMKNCQFNNCRLYTYPQHFKNETEFDAIIINGADLGMFNPNNTDKYGGQASLPAYRSKEQIYIFFSIEPPCLYPLFYNFDGYFNATWTYKTDSNVTFPYLIVTNEIGEDSAPKRYVQWKDRNEIREVSESIKEKLQSKATAAAWLVSHCAAKSKRDEFGHKLTKELSKFGLKVDVYGVCGSHHCPPSECYGLIEKRYYFYLAFENSICKDYVTEKVLHGLQNYAVPVVYGGANYTRFMPPGSYLNARELGPAKLAEKMNELIEDKNKYFEYFEWHGYYEFRNVHANLSEIDDQFCKLCKFLNKMNRTEKPYIFPDIVNWWNEPNNTWCRRYASDIPVA